jgi:hypothetical protein
MVKKLDLTNGKKYFAEYDLALGPKSAHVFG